MFKNQIISYVRVCFIIVRELTVTDAFLKTVTDYRRLAWYSLRGVQVGEPTQSFWKEFVATTSRPATFGKDVSGGGGRYCSA